MDKDTGHSNHGNAAMLALNSTVTGEGFLIRNVTEGVEISKRSYSSDFVLELSRLK